MLTNHLNERQKEVAELVEDWTAVFSRFGVKGVTNTNNGITASCPVCRKPGGAVITVDSQRGYPIWYCSCKGNRQAFDSFLGLIAAAKGVSGEGARGNLLGQIEAFALEKNRTTELPDWTYDFGTHRGKKMDEAPPNYNVWAAQNVSSMPKPVAEQVLRAYGLEVSPSNPSKLAKSDMVEF